MCWNTAAADDRDLKKMNIKSFKLLSLKDNIRTRMIGLGWEDLSTRWSSSVKASNMEELKSHLKMMYLEF